MELTSPTPCRAPASSCAHHLWSDADMGLYHALVMPAISRAASLKGPYRGSRS